MSLREKKPTFILLNKKRLNPEVKENIIKKRFTITKKKNLVHGMKRKTKF